MRRGGLGPEKSKNFERRPQSFAILSFSARIASGPRFGTLLGSFWEGIWRPRWSKPISKVPLGRPRADPSNVFWALEASKSSPRAFQEASRLPRQLQELSKRLEDRFWSRFGSHFGAILERFWSHVAAILELFWRLQGRRQMHART